MTAAAQLSVPLTTERTRIPIPAVHRPETKRPPRLQDALDFWQFSGAAATWPCRWRGREWGTGSPIPGWNPVR